MNAMKRKAGRKKRGAPGADELQSDAVLAKEMGISISKLNRIVRLSEATKDVCDAVDDHSIELSIAAEISFLKPHNQDEVIHLAGIGYKPNVKRVQRLRAAEKNGKLDDMTMRNILEDKDIQLVKPPEPPKPAPAQPDPPFPVASMVTPNVSPAPAPTAGTSPATSAPIPPDMKPVMPESPKQESTPQPPAAQTTEKPETAPEPVNNVISISAESKQLGESKAADDEPIEFNSPRENLYSLKITLGGDRLRRYFPDVTMPALAIVESIYSALEERRQREIHQEYLLAKGARPMPLLTDWRAEVLQQPDPEAREIALAAELITEGSLNVFAHPTNVDISNRIVVLDLYEMGEQLRPTALVVALEAIQNRVMENRKRGKYTWVFLDEVYLYFKYKYSGEILYRAWKRFRKYGAALTAASQNVEECLKSETARLMFANSEFLLLFNQAATDRAELSKLLHISDTQLGYITNAEAGHGLLRMGGSIVPFVNTIPRQTELYKLMTTTPGENLV